ncbi:alpha/beta fold hydrolase [Actinoplanes solisilvae]|uniref:alpha/beta fold hydrolase n=1 Tax=Actinoplanes solisilvae TaxID=2486853 RepID=UPI001F0BDAA2|nr:alpha/beta fold hydrolase [Actinoplanes solisilvae]
MRRLIVSLLATTLTCGSAAPALAAPSPVLPVPSHVFQWTDHGSPGTVLSKAPAVLPPELRSLADAQRIKYVTTDVRGRSTTATGLVLTPKERRKNKTVAWAHGTTGLADKCAPSTNHDVFWPEARVAVASLLRRGWTVAATDYAGIGTPEPHPYLVGNSEGRAIIDSVRAARNLDDGLSPQYVVDGHSQGAQGALFANQLAGAYDGELRLRGTVSIAPTSGVETLAALIPQTEGKGYLVMALYGLNAVEPSFKPAEVLAAPAERKLGVLESGCLYDILGAYATLTPQQLLVGGELPDRWVKKLVEYVEPGLKRPTAPVFVVQGADDVTVPSTLTDALVERLRAYDGASVRYDELPGEDHDSSVIASADRVANWIAQRFE